MEENFEYDIRLIWKVWKSPSPSENLVFIENMGCSLKHKVKSWQRKKPWKFLKMYWNWSIFKFCPVFFEFLSTCAQFDIKEDWSKKQDVR